MASRYLFFLLAGWALLLASYPVVGTALPVSNNTLSGGLCAPNPERTGLNCYNIVGQNTTVYGSWGVVWANLSTVFENTTRTFLYNVSASVTYQNLTNQPLAQFAFNSSTPNGTEIAANQTTVGVVMIPSGMPGAVPSVPVKVALGINITLLRPQNVTCSNGSICDATEIYGTIGIFASGNAGNQASNLTLTAQAPRAGYFTVHFNPSVNSTSFCETINYVINYNKTLSGHVVVCPKMHAPMKGLKCKDMVQQSQTRNANGTVANNVCFKPSFTVS